MIFLKIYLYDEKTKEYMSEGNAQLDPLETQKAEEDVFIMPANSTTVKPAQKDGYAAVWNGKKWDLEKRFIICHPINMALLATR